MAYLLGFLVPNRTIPHPVARRTSRMLSTPIRDAVFGQSPSRDKSTL
jgi:hypothetical protein